MENLSGVTNGDVDKVYVASVHLCKRAEILESPGAQRMDTIYCNKLQGSKFDETICQASTKVDLFQLPTMMCNMDDAVTSQILLEILERVCIQYIIILTPEYSTS